jgi:putative protein-disulfide isomerase
MAAVNDSTSPAGATLHYIFDPMCGWCYAAAPLVDAARSVPGLRVEFHGGGMMTGANRRAITPQWRDYVMPHDHRIAELTGQPFGEAYFEGLLRDIGATMDSEPPTTAILAADALRAGGGLDMIHRLQRAHYVEGRRIADVGVLTAVAAELGFDGEAFAPAFARLSGEETSRHFAESRQLLQRQADTAQAARAFRPSCWHRPTARQATSTSVRGSAAPTNGRHSWPRSWCLHAPRRRPALARRRAARTAAQSRPSPPSRCYLLHWKLPACDASPPV